jgi:hypothetical protein
LVLAGCCTLVVALVISHQLTPGILLSAVILLIAVNATRLRVLPVFIAVVFLAWLSFGADAYWLGHFDNLTGSVGKVGSLVDQNVTNRTESAVFSRQVVLASRIGLALLAWGLATLSLVVQWVRRSTPMPLFCLLLAPFPMLLLQPYGGEMALRVCYFSLPAASILIAQLLPAPFASPTSSTSNWCPPELLHGRLGALKDSSSKVVRPLVSGVLILAIIPAFITARFGNESFESFSNDDVLLARTMYSVVPDNSTVFLASQQSVKYSERVAGVRFRQLPRGTAAEITDNFRKHFSGTNVFVELTESQQAYGVVFRGRPADWMQDLSRDLQLTGQYRVIAAVGEGVLLQLEPQ